MRIRSASRRHLKIIAPFVVLLVSTLIAGALVASATENSKESLRSSHPIVNVVEVKPQTVQLRVKTNGTIEPETETNIVPRVTGEVIWMSPSMVPGGFFKKDQLLIRVDARDYEVEVQRAEAKLLRLKSDLDVAGRELDRIRGLRGSGVSSAAQFDDAQNRFVAATSDYSSAEMDLLDAKRDLWATEIRAPYDGRVRNENVDVGGSVDFRSEPIATIYGTDFAEVRLPIADYEVGYLSLPLWGGNFSQAEGKTAIKQQKVEVRASFAGDQHTWSGYVVRTEGEINPETRMINVVARIENPYQRSGKRPPLTVGLFVDAEIIGNTVDAVFVLPRSSLRDSNRVLVVDSEDRLRLIEVGVLRATGDLIYIDSGLTAGDRVVVSRLSHEVEGMKLQPRTVPVDENGLVQEWQL
jgi:RND family efflux transporter MFP subunit